MMQRMTLVLAVIVAACSSPPVAPPQPPVAPPAATPTPVETAPTPAFDDELSKRLAYLTKRLDEAREGSHVPGMSVAVVKDGKVIFARGFGVVDIETKAPVTADTTFMVGSTTKAFTATLLGMQVDEGAVAWDDPLSKHVPLTLAVEGDRKPTIRDALSHQTGYARMTLLLLGKLTPDQMYQYAGKARPTAKVGEKWQYNNVMYMTAGDISARRAGAAWTALVAQRIFKPLGMAHTTAVLDEAKAAGSMATGYTWLDHRKEWEREAPRDIGATSPAGAIVSSANDMARWLQFQLAGGEFAGKRLISPGSLAETHKPQIKMSDSGETSYGLGWMIRTWQGHRYLEHGGNIDGFGANTGFLPDKGIGYVVLTNTTGNSVQNTTGPMVFEALLTDAYQGKTGVGEDFGPLLGEYVADFPPFDGKSLKVVEKAGKLAVDVPGQTVYELKPPDKDGKRYFALTDQIFVTFTLEGRRAAVLNMHQNGFMMEIWRKGTEPKADVDMSVAGPLLGGYKADDGTVFTVLVHRGRLAVDVPGQLKYALRPPVDGKWRLRARDDYYVTFADNGLVVHQGDKRVSAKRVSRPARKTTMTMAKLDKLRRPAKRRKAIASMRYAVSEATVTLHSAGLSGTITSAWTGLDNWRQDWNLAPIGTISMATTATSGWLALTFDTDKQLKGKELTVQRMAHPLSLAGDWRALFDKVELRGTDTVSGKSVAVVDLSLADAPAITAYVDVKTGDVIRATFPALQGPSTTIDFSDFRRVRGLRVSFKQTFKSPIFGAAEIQQTSLKVRQKQPADAFPATLPKP